MERFKSVTIIILLAGGLLASAALAKSAGVLLQEGLYAEEIEGDLDKAIKIYQQIIKDDSAQRVYTAQAVYRLGMCYLKKQNEQQAKAAFEKLTAQFPEQTSIIKKAQPLLDEMSSPDPAVLMPPDTKIYLEFGSPSRHIETILNMLKGTPFENPLAVIGGDAGQKPPEEKSPGDVLAALLNPSMMAEFKKIRGMAVGIMGLGNNPPMVVVLFPGKSDALRGIILAALGMAGKPAEPIEDMQTLQIGNTAGAAYDDNVIIIAQPLEQLNWCAKQYKGITSEPTLISQNKVFAKLSRKIREDNVLTIWLDGASTFEAISEQMTKSGQAAQVRLLNGIADLNSLEGVVAHLSIRESNIIVEVNVGFKEGHNCLIYDLIRTPNLNRDAFKAVPAQAVVVAGFALSQSDSSHTEAVQKTVKKLTGLDVGREIFANIEQVAIFALPPTDGFDSNTPAQQGGNVMSGLGLTVTSKNPQQTRQLLTQLLTVADLAAKVSVSGQSGQQAEPPENKYRIATVKGQEVYLYMGQVGNTTILAFSPVVLQASLSAMKSKQSVLTDGPMQETLSHLPPQTSKLVAVNVGGAIRIADTHINWKFENPSNPGHQLLRQLAQACDNTSVQLRTEEKLNNFGLRLSVNKLPPLGPVFGLLMQMSQIDLGAKAKATGPVPADRTVVSPTAKTALSWRPGINASKHKVYFGTKIDELLLLAEVADSSYAELPALEKDTTYYWRIDEVGTDGSVVPGDVWSFSTGKLIGWWKLDEKVGGIAADSSGNGNNGTLCNFSEPHWVDGIIDGALKFDGNNDYVSIPHNPSFHFVNNDFSAAFWMLAESWANPQEDSRTMIDFESGDWRGWLVRYSEYYNKIMLGGSGRERPILNTLPTTGQRHHIAVTYSEGSGIIKGYLDGKLDKTVSENLNLTIGTSPHGIGSNPENDDQAFDGVLDDVRVYNYTLSEAEVKALYSSARADLAEERLEKSETEPENK